jgi:hypothetical protein
MVWQIQQQRLLKTKTKRVFRTILRVQTEKIHMQIIHHFNGTNQITTLKIQSKKNRFFTDK